MLPEHGFSAQLAAGTTLYVGTRLGFPISTTHVVTGSVMGAGSTRRFSAVRWGVAGNITTAWLLTLPGAALAAAAFYYPVQWLF
jgi:PiT family inorganic phosphate transporter